MKKQSTIWIFGVVILVMACTLGTEVSTPESHQIDEVGTAVAATMQALTEAAPPTPLPPTQPSGIAITFRNVSFVIPEGLAGGATGEELPAITGTDLAPWDIPPAHLELTLTGYQLQDKFLQPRIYILPAKEYAEQNEGALRNILALQATNPEWAIGNLPHVPFFNAAQVFAARIQPIRFQSGNGVRFITEYAQYYAPINNYELFYQFQGVTGSGNHYLIVVLPVTASMLAPDEKPDSPVPPGGIPFPGFDDPNANFEMYYQQITDALNTAGNDSFAPILDQLDALIQSITVTP